MNVNTPNVYLSYSTFHQVGHPRQRQEDQQAGDQEEEQGHLEAIGSRV